MSLPLDKFRAKLVVKILHAENDIETTRYVRAALKGMKDRKLNGYIITRFIDRVISQLASLPSTEMEYKQWDIVRGSMRMLQGMRGKMATAIV